MTFARRLAVSITTLAALLAAPAAVLAGPPVGTCAPAYTPASYDELADAYPDLVDLLGGPAGWAAFLDGINANGNDTICYRPIPPNASHIVVNVIDDVARSPHA